MMNKPFNEFLTFQKRTIFCLKKKRKEKKEQNALNKATLGKRVHFQNLPIIIKVFFFFFYSNYSEQHKWFYYYY